MAKTSPHTHRFSSLWYPPQWYYILWMYSFEKWMNHSTHYLSSRGEIPYPPKTFRNWKLQKARQSLFWPLLNSEIEDMIKKWRTCLTFQNRQSSEPIINHPIPNQAWIKTDADPFRSYGHYLLMINCYSKFIVIEALKNLQFSTVMNKCKYIFSQFGTPKGLVTNNGPKPTSHYFKWFLRTWDFELLARIFTNQRD